MPILFSLQTRAQWNGDWIKSDQLSLRVNSEGQLATYNSQPGSEFTEGSNNHMFKFINVWISAKDINDQLHIASVNGFENKTDFSPGPTDSLTYVGADPIIWNKVWSVAATEILNHKRNFKEVNYNMSSSIKNWPANGPKGYNKYLAPFIDDDKDGIYEPSKGDYPDILGDNAVYFIANDNFLEHKASTGIPLIVEVYGMAYNLKEISNTIFVRYYIVNRTDKDFKDIKIGIHTGFQLGNSNDNYCGTLVNKNLVFAYNGDDNDENHFGLSKPLASVMILNHTLSSSLIIEKDTNSKFGMATTPSQHRWLMEGKWKSNKILTFGGNGMDNSAAANYIFPGKSDPDFSKDNWVENSTPGERSMLANVSISTLKTKEFIELDLAISGFDKSEGDPYNFIEQQANDIRNKWLNQILSEPKIHLINKYRLKNPIYGDEIINQDWFGDFDELEVVNSLGRMIEKINLSNKNLIKIEKSGIYFLNFKSENQVITKKILIL